MLAIIIISHSEQSGALGLRENLEGFGREKKKLLMSYLQGIVSIHHPTVCPGGHNQEPSSKKG